MAEPVFYPFDSYNFEEEEYKTMKKHIQEFPDITAREFFEWMKKSFNKEFTPASIITDNTLQKQIQRQENSYFINLKEHLNSL